MPSPTEKITPEDYEQQFASKCREIIPAFLALGAPPPELFTSPPLNFRMRAEFRVWHSREGGHHCYYAMFDPKAPKTPIRVDHFPIVSPAIEQLMLPLMQAINADNCLSKKLFQIEFLSSTQGDVVVSLIYHRQLDSTWETQAKQLEALFNISIIGRARKQRLVLSRDTVTEKLTIQGKDYFYQQQENSFTQPNAAINQEMIAWCCHHLQSDASAKRHSLLEMYCGNGNFTLPLASHFRHVLATEISKNGIQSAKINAARNRVSNIEFVRLSGEETAQALDGVRPFRRLAHLDLAKFNFSTVFVDPPRAGLDENTLAFIERFDEILYISCNPTTLAENIKALSSTHRIDQFAIFDQFPYTPHAECGTLLKRY